MNCGNGLAIPGADTRFLCRPISRHAPFLPLGYPPTRIHFGPLRANARIGDGPVNAAAEQELSFYELLGIPQTGTLPELKQAYKQLARKYHPDVSPPDRVEEYTERFILVQEAYETLSDPRRRALYDRDLAKGIRFAFG